jgi:hypothetical protein
MIQSLSSDLIWGLALGAELSEIGNHRHTCMAPLNLPKI